MVTDHGLYIKDDFNTTDWIPTAGIADHAAWLSNSWADDNYSTQSNRNARNASSTTMNVAFMAGSVTGVIGRYLEDWGGTSLNLDTSFVLLYPARHTLAANTTANTYVPPARNFDFDFRFAQGQMPPMTPQFTYSRQEMFTRNFEW